MNYLRDAKLVLFFTRGVSLYTWDQICMFEREVKIYRRLLSYLGRNVLFSYGDRSELRYASYLDGIDILCNRWGLPERWYIRLVSLLHPLLWRVRLGTRIPVAVSYPLRASP